MYEFIKERLKELGATQRELCQQIKLDPTHLSAVFKGIRLIKASEIIPMAKFLQVDIENFTKYIAGQISDAEMLAVPVRQLYKVGYVQAGKFNDAQQLPESMWEPIPYPVNDNYKKSRLFALGVKGDSMNLTFPPDVTTLICCPLQQWLEINPETPLEGKYIIAYRKTPDGKYEATVKKYTKIDENTIILVAESSNPEIRPIVIHPDNNEYEVHAVVISYLRNC